MSAYDAVEGVRFGSFHNLSLSNRRRPDGTRPFKLVEAEPLQTSYGTDLYRAIFGDVSGKVLRQERKQ
jgi:hypothetical protein